MADILYPISLGLISGLIPVYLGLLPLPLFRRLPLSSRNLLISFSVGILLFLFSDVMGEAIELAGNVGAGPFLFAIGLVLGLVGPFAIASRRHGANPSSSVNAPPSGSKFFTAYMISVGIGLHNLGEGLAIGSAYAAGQFGLTTILVVGFALHNGTEGLGISRPISDAPIHLREPLVMGFLAGFPTIIGCVIGSVAYSSLLGTLFFSVAGGALLFVVVELLRRAYPSKGTFSGLAMGILLMYFTDLLLSI
jgi:ZIP family zinc transporter